MASQAIPHSISYNYDELFKIQRVRNPFSLRPVSYSALASYLECPWCTLIQKRKRRPKEPARFTPVQQASLFSNGVPDPRSVGTLLHTTVNFLHMYGGPVAYDQQQILLHDSGSLVRFIHNDLLEALQKEGKNNLAMFFNSMCQNSDTLYKHMIAPLLRYQRELAATNTTVFTAAERFQCKISSTRNTFPDYPDRGGYVGLVGEFDQIRLRRSSTPGQGTPIIVEFKKGLGGKKPPEKPQQPSLFEEEEIANEAASPTLTQQPTVFHAMQLMVYWLAFQTRWDISQKFKEARGFLQDVQMPFQQDLELLIYNLNDGHQYQLQPTSYTESLTALTECIFYLDWAMKNGYSWQSPEHGCRRPQLTDLPEQAIRIQVGTTLITGQECYQLARSAFERFSNTITWQEKLPATSRNNPEHRALGHQ